MVRHRLSDKNLYQITSSLAGQSLQQTDMNNILGHVFVLLLIVNAKVKGVDIRKESSNVIVKQETAEVVSLAFCDASLTSEDTMGKKTLEEVHTYAQLKVDPLSSFPASFTVCSTVMASCPSIFWPTIFNILDNCGSQFLTGFFKQGSIESQLWVSSLTTGTSQPVAGELPTLFSNQWTRSCLALNTTSGGIDWVVDGTLVLTKKFQEMIEPKCQPKNLKQKLLVGARLYGGLWFSSSESVTNMNIYSSPLSIRRMKSITRGESCGNEGDYLAWRDMEWALHGKARIEIVNKKEPCGGEPFADLYYTEFPMEACMNHCENLRTRAPPVATFEDWTALQTFLKMKSGEGLNTLDFWLPVKDSDVEGIWKDFHDGSLIQNYTPPWIGSKPDGGRAENCAAVRTADQNSWSDNPCKNPYYACMCSYSPATYLQLRGLCHGSAIDVHYKPMNDRKDNKNLKLQGLKKTSIAYDKKVKKWILDVTDMNLIATSRAPHASFTLGKHNWTIEGDEDCNAGEVYVTELKMSGCQDGNFTCRDGQCVSMDLRCNQLPDCRDKSDERNCQILVLEEGYNKNVPPIRAQENVNVNVSIDLLKLVNIDEDDYSIEIQFKITLKWKENRATYHNLKENVNLNALTQYDILTLWLPNVIYENTDQKETTRLGEIGNGEWKTKIVVKKEGNSTRGGLHMVDETEIFQGSENLLIMSQTYTHTFQCPYKLSHYPFDTQVISKHPSLP